ncbi:MAG TPA: hypothetical protein V6D17_11075 [Candidatus Obscuribacterales bacterium]
MDYSLVTYSDLPQLDPDDVFLANELAKRGYQCQPLIWNDPHADWANAGCAVIRSTWDYHLYYDQFLSWVKRVSAVTRLVNESPLVEWNSNKKYLQDLEACGVPIVPTHWLSAVEAKAEARDEVTQAAGRTCPATKDGASNFNLGAILLQHQWSRAVIKPCIGLATFGVEMIALTDEGIKSGLKHIEKLSTAGDIMIQPYIASVQTHGERALVYFKGEFSHAVRKTAFQPLRPAGRAGEEAVVAERDEIELGEKAIETVVSIVGKLPNYARVDVVRDEQQKPLVMELELVEPSLFLSMHEKAAARFADALLQMS